MASRKRSRGEESDGANQNRRQAREGVRIGPEDSSGKMENELELGTPVPTPKLELVGTLPKLIVLDLDKTLWPFYCHEQTTGPYSRMDDHKDAVKCRSPYGAEKVVRLFPEVVDVLSCLKQQGSIRLSVASRSPIEGPARGILLALGLLEYFCCLEIHRGSKSTHLKNISAATGVPYRDMLFFDDDDSNIKSVSKLGVCCICVNKESGLTFAAVQSGMKKYKEVHLTRLSLAAWLSPSPSNGAANRPDKVTVAPPKQRLKISDRASEAS